MALLGYVWGANLTGQFGDSMQELWLAADSELHFLSVRRVGL
jgi:hypothetical protein